MNLNEYQTKAIFSRYNIPIPMGKIALTTREVLAIAEELGGKVVLKAQVLAGGRGKAGGIRLVKTLQEAEEAANQIFSMEIKGLKVHKILVDSAIRIKREIYLGIVINQNNNQPVLMASSEDGTNIEKIAADSPEKIIKVPIDPLIGLRDYQARDVAINIDLPTQHWKQFMAICKSMWQVFWENDATLVEINPLVITDEQQLMALDGKMIVDDNALFRHPDIGIQRSSEIELPGEAEARKYGLVYVKLDGDIGCMVNGAGLAMATLDMIKHFGGEPANFMDIGKVVKSEKVEHAFRIISSDPNVKAILVYIFESVTHCDLIAHEIIKAIADTKTMVPVITRLIGPNADEGVRLLAAAQIITTNSLDEAAVKAIMATKGDISS